MSLWMIVLGSFLGMAAFHVVLLVITVVAKRVIIWRMMRRVAADDPFIGYPTDPGRGGQFPAQR